MPEVERDERQRSDTQRYNQRTRARVAPAKPRKRVEADEDEWAKILESIRAGLGGSGKTGRKPYGGRDIGAVRSVLGQARFQFPFDISRFVDQTIRLEEGADYLTGLILRSPEFRNYYLGIFRPDGRLRMTPEKWQDLFDTSQTLAAQSGFGLTRQDFGNMVARNVTSEQQIVDRFRGIQAARSNPKLVEYMNNQIADRNAVRMAKGLPPIQSLSDLASQVRFFTQQSDEDVYQLFEAATFAEGAASSNLKISSQKARELAASTAGLSDPDDVRKAFIEIADQARRYGPELYQFGVSQDDLMKVQFGGPGQGAAALRVAQAAQQREAQLAAEQIQTQTQSERGRPVVPTDEPVAL